jgi:hypothetical protein
MTKILLTWMEMGKYGELSSFKSSRGRRGAKGGSGRALGEDSMYVR